jgi:hypothetical protein
LPKLVCGAAKNKAGCRYVSVCIREVEAALLSNWGGLFASVPADDPEGTVNAEYEALDAAIHGTEDHLADLCEAHDRAPTVHAARSIARVEAELRTMREQLTELDERRAMSDRGLIASRMGELHELLSDEETRADRRAVNAALKVIFSGVTVDYRAGLLRFHWRQGGEAVMSYAWPREAA